MHSAEPTMTESARRFAVALSFPGEVRARAEPIANLLAHELGRTRVFYDRFHEAELARLNLDVRAPLSKRGRKATDVGAMFAAIADSDETEDLDDSDE